MHEVLSVSIAFGLHVLYITPTQVLYHIFQKRHCSNWWPAIVAEHLSTHYNEAWDGQLNTIYMYMYV